jgi:biopolymer transport protein ExbB/TolQ
MEITYFALGMLSMVALFFIGVIVWGVFKVMKIESQIVDIKESHRFDVDNIQRQFDQAYRSIGELRDDSYREVHELNRDVYQKFDKIEKYEIQRFEELLKIVHDRFDDSIRYTDKRVDKSLNQKEIL